MDKDTDIIYREIGDRLLKARKNSELSQEQLAALCGIDRSHVGFIEQGRRRPTVDTIYKMANEGKKLDTRTHGHIRDESGEYQGGISFRA